MRKALVLMSVLLAASAAFAAPPTPSAAWKAKVAATMPLLGHRNWILIVDSPYPLLGSTGSAEKHMRAKMADAQPAVAR